MTMNSAAWAINGPLTDASLARQALYASSRQEGIVQKDDLKVTELDTPGVGVLIADGTGLVLNRYQNDPNEMYVVSNSGSHTIPSSEMPASNPDAKSYLVAVVVGDPDFSQAGHPWMQASDPPVGEESTFQYVRPTLIEVPAGTTSADSLNFPALALARIDIPANTTTITNSMITDLRKLAAPRSEQTVFVSPPDTFSNANPRRIASGTTFADWGVADYSPTVTVPEWASRAIVIASINGVRLADTSVNVVGFVRTQLGTVSGPQTTFDFPVGTGAIRTNLQTAGEYDTSSVAGSTIALRVEGYESVPEAPTDAQRLALQSGSQMIFDVRFFEE